VDGVSCLSGQPALTYDNSGVRNSADRALPSLTGRRCARIGPRSAPPRFQDKRQIRTGQNELFSSDSIPEKSFEQLVEEDIQAAKKWIVALLREHNTSIQFGVLVPKVLELLLLRETNVKNLCVQLANAGIIDNTWKAASKNKPYDGSPISLSKATIA